MWDSEIEFLGFPSSRVIILELCYERWPLWIFWELFQPSWSWYVIIYSIFKFHNILIRNGWDLLILSQPSLDLHWKITSFVVTSIFWLVWLQINQFFSDESLKDIYKSPKSKTENPNHPYPIWKGLKMELVRYPMS